MTDTASKPAKHRLRFLRSRWFLGLVGVFLAMWAIHAIHHAMQPKYQGKTAEEWFKQLDAFSVIGASDQLSSWTEDPTPLAFRNFGPEAAQFLWKEYKISNHSQITYLLVHVYNFFAPESWAIDSGIGRHMKAFMLLEAMGPRADCLMPELVRHAQKTSGDERYEVLQIISHIGTRPELTVPLLTSNMNTANGGIWAVSVYGLQRLGPPGSNALPFLEKQLHSRTNAHERLRIASAMVGIGDKSKLNYLLSEIQNTGSPYQIAAFQMLVSLKTNAMDAVLTLSMMTNNPATDSTARDLAEKSIEMIINPPTNRIENAP